MAAFPSGLFLLHSVTHPHTVTTPRTPSSQSVSWQQVAMLSDILDVVCCSKYCLCNCHGVGRTVKCRKVPILRHPEVWRHNCPLKRICGDYDFMKECNSEFMCVSIYEYLRMWEVVFMCAVCVYSWLWVCSWNCMGMRVIMCVHKYLNVCKYIFECVNVLASLHVNELVCEHLCVCVECFVLHYGSNNWLDNWEGIWNEPRSKI